MKLVLRDYIESLKEDEELDALICELLLNMSFSIISRPEKGVRQFGVDISAVGYDPDDAIKEKKLFLFVVKMGAFTRTTWDSDVNSIRPSIVEIFDTYIDNRIPEYCKNLPIKIIVATNGLLNSSVLENWSGYIKKHTSDNITFGFWGIDDLPLKIERFLLNGKLFTNSIQDLLKKTLVFLDVTDYDLTHFYSLIDEIYSGIDISKKSLSRKNLRLLRSANLCLSIIYRRGIEINNLKPVIYASERLLLVTWGMLSKNNLLTKNYIGEFNKIQLLKERIDFQYLSKLRHHFYAEQSLSRSAPNHLEYGLITYEQIGIISNIGIYYMNLCEIFSQVQEDGFSLLAQKYFESAEIIADDLSVLIQKNPSAFFPFLDEHLIEINSALTLLYLTERKHGAITWINTIIENLVHYYKLSKIHPQFVTNVEELYEFYFMQKEQKVTSSTIMTLLAEWCIILENPKLYQKLGTIIERHFKEINLQMWFPEKETESEFCFKNVSNTGSIKYSIKLYANPLEYEAEMAEERMLFKAEGDFSILKQSINYLAFIAFRHYRTPPFPNMWRDLLRTRFCFNNNTNEEK